MLASVRISYELTPVDYAEYAIAHFDHQESRRLSVQVVRIGFPAVWLVVAVLRTILRHGGIVDLLIVVGAVLWMILLPLHMRRAAGRRVHRAARGGINRGVLGRRQLEITDAGIIESTAYWRHETFWGGVERVIDAPNHLLLYTGARTAHIVPKCALAGDPSALISAIEARLQKGSARESAP